jgi:hypothetical protein
MFPVLTGAFMQYRSGVCRIELVPQAVEQILDLLVRHAQPTFVLAGISYIAEDKREKGNKGLARLARACGIGYRAYSDRDIIAIAREDLGILLDSIMFHWSFHCWDAPHAPLPSVMARQAEAFEQAISHVRYRPALHLLDGAYLFVESGEDNDLALEARDPALTQAAFARAVETLTAEAVAHTTGRSPNRSTVARLPSDVLEYFRSTLPEFALRATDATGKPDQVRVVFGARVPHWREFEPIGHLDYDLRTERWAYRYG